MPKGNSLVRTGVGPGWINLRRENSAQLGLAAVYPAHPEDAMRKMRS